LEWRWSLRVLEALDGPPLFRVGVAVLLSGA
jgi:hypothetical protein